MDIYTEGRSISPHLISIIVCVLLVRLTLKRYQQQVRLEVIAISASDYIETLRPLALSAKLNQESIQIILKNTIAWIVGEKSTNCHKGKDMREIDQSMQFNEFKLAVGNNRVNITYNNGMIMRDLSASDITIEDWMYLHSYEIIVDGAVNKD